MHLIKTLTLALLCLSVYSGISQPATHTPRYESLSANTAAYYEYLPEGYDPAATARYPVILFLHGAGDMGNGSIAELPRLLQVGIPKLIHEGAFPTSFSVGGQTYKFIIISPQFTNYPAEADAVNDVQNILNAIGQRYKVDLNRVYITGISMGGGFTFDYAGNSPANAQRLAAIVPIANAAYPVQAKARIIADADLPVWATHNSGDPNVPVNQTTLYTAWINEAPAPDPAAKQTIFSSNVHDAWTATYDPAYRENGLNVYEWMLQFQRAIILPVTLSSYKATANGNGVVIEWTTASEQNNAYFTIERSVDGTSFESIGRVEGGNRPGNYRFTDARPLDGVNFYRLKQTDHDGRSTFHGVLRVSVVKTGSSVSVLPNPARQFIQVKLQGIEGALSLSLHNAAGAIIKKWTVDKGVGDHTETVQLGALPEGAYFLHVAGRSVSEKIQFVKKN